MCTASPIDVFRIDNNNRSGSGSKSLQTPGTSLTQHVVCYRCCC